MQMTIVAICVIYLASRVKGKFLHLISSFIMLGIVHRMYLAYTIKLDVSLLDSQFDPHNAYLMKLYYPTDSRIIPYFTGIIGGYLLFNSETGAKIFNFVNKPMQLIIWAYTINHLLSPFGVKNVISLLNHNLIANVIIECYGKVFWAWSIVWIILACQNGHGGIVNNFLSHKFWMPFSKLGFAIYLSHMVIQHNIIASSPLQTDFETLHMVRNIMRVLSLKYNIKYCLSIFISAEELHTWNCSHCSSCNRHVHSCGASFQSDRKKTFWKSKEKVRHWDYFCEYPGEVLLNLKRA